MVLEEEDELIFARFTPAYNITWPGPVVPPAEPLTLDFSGFGLPRPNDITPEGISLYLDEQMKRVLDL
jgi:hypothetical protein